MTSVSIFEYRDYKKFLLDWIARAPHAGRGLRKQIADAIGCQTPFITHVLGGDYHLSAEQADACGRWLELGEKEIEYFVLLVLRDRAGTLSLRKMLDRQIIERREGQSLLKKRVKIQQSLSEIDQVTYYSSWHYAAIHLAVLDASLRTVEALQSKFQIPVARLLGILEFLCAKGLLKKEKNCYRTTENFLYLDPHSPLIQHHHTNWRLKAIDAVTVRNPNEIHYSGVLSLSHEDYEWVRGKLSTLLEETADRLKNSADEKLAVLNFDLFGL